MGDDSGLPRRFQKPPQGSSVRRKRFGDGPQRDGVKSVWAMLGHRPGEAGRD